MLDTSVKTRPGVHLRSGFGPQNRNREIPLAGISVTTSTQCRSSSRVLEWTPWSPPKKWLWSAKQEPRNPFSWDFRDHVYPMPFFEQGPGVDFLELGFTPKPLRGLKLSAMKQAPLFSTTAKSGGFGYGVRTKRNPRWL